MIIFKTLKYKNFLSSGAYFTTINLEKCASTLIVGQNGSGKSTMLDALCFVLFGRPFRKINKPQLINSINQKDSIVEIEFQSGNKSYKIIRGLKPTIFDIYCNDEKLNQSASIKDFQEYFEKNILKLNFKSFTQIVILGSASFTPFMQLTAADRRAIIEDLLDIQIFSSMNNVVKSKMILNRESTDQTALLIESCKEKIEMQNRYIADLNQNTKQLILSYKNEISNNEIDIENLLDLNKKDNENIENLSVHTDIKKDIESKIKIFVQLETQLNSSISKLKKDIVFFDNHDNCPTCKQGILHEFKDSQIKKLQHKIEECDSAIKKIDTKISKTTESLDSINNILDKIDILKKNITINETKIIEIEKTNKKINDKILELENKNNVSSKDEIILQSLHQNLEQLEEKRKFLIEEKTYLDVASFLLKDSGIKTKIIRQYLPVINKLINKYLNVMDFFVNFSLDENFKEIIKSRHRDEFSYDSFSEGEKQRIDISLLLTWRSIAKLKNSVNTNLLIMDEIFDSSLDATGTEELMKILDMLDDVNLFIISHKGDLLQDKFSNILRFQKKQNFSRMII